MNLPSHLSAKLEERKAQNAYRNLRLLPRNMIDFCSNDYLGIVRNHLLSDINVSQLRSGSTGSRLLTGNYDLIEETEQQIAAFHEAESALIFNSGYDANLGVLSSLPQKGDTIIYDALCHASIRDGIRLSFAKAFSFFHNDIDDLRKKIRSASGTIYIVTESVFSMDGDVCPLKEIVSICSQYNAYLILDEAHSIGVIGERGEGLAQQLQLHQNVFCRIYTFGKACGCHGAVVTGSKDLRNYLVNFSRSFIYSTALPEHSVATIQKSYQVFPKLIAERMHLQTFVYQFQNAFFPYEKLISETPIQAILIPGNNEVRNVANTLQQNNIDVRPVLYPTVPKGKERLRVILHSYNTENEIALLAGQFKV